MKICDYDYVRDGRQIKVNCLNCVYGASVEDFEACMARTIDKILEVRNANSVVLSQTRDFEYGYEETHYLTEIAQALRTLLEEKNVLKFSNFGTSKHKRYSSKNIAFVQEIVTNRIRRDPIGAYVEIVREIRHVHSRIVHAHAEEKQHLEQYLNKVLIPIRDVLHSTKLIQFAEPDLTGYHVGDRALYRDIFHPVIRPNFMLTRYMMTPPQNAREVERYDIENIEVQIYRRYDMLERYYHVLPPEFTLSEDEYTLLDVARQYMAAHKPTKSEFAEPERMRDVFYNIGRDMLSEIAKNMNIELDKEKLDLLATILVRYTAGYGVLEVLLSDPKVQDIYINSPVGESPVFLFHQDHEDCVTNIIPTKEDSLAWATRFRIESGRPLDEANPVLDTEISIPGGRARVAAITKTLSPEGLAFALRRHRDKPWTYPLFIKNRALTPLAAGLLSFITDGARTILFAGTRSSGKSSFLGATLTEIMKNLRIVTVEDTLELPVEQLRALGYNIERLKSRSVITHIESELPTEEVIRTSLRLGDSCLIIGEVRSKEALALYESMRIGALANVVAGTIHGDSPYGVFDRVVNDLGVPPTSFKATDIIVVANRLKSADGLHTSRRIIEITEVRKDWDKDPQREKGFVPLMVYNSKTDELEPTETFLNGESFILSEIAKRVRDWRDNWEAVWDNIQLRAKLKETLVDYSTSMNKPSLLEAEFVISANNQFHLLSESVREEYGNLDSDRIFARWNEWAKNEIKSMR